MAASNIKSSLPLEILLFANARFSIVFYLLIVAIYLYKLSFLHYTPYVQLSEIVIIVLFVPIEALRLSWARRGNLTETAAFISFALLLNAAVLSICAYLVFFQGYVLLIEIILASLEGSFVIIETIFCIAAITQFSK
ncbi:putative membrane protein domain-containing protein [Ditylenchus destructor]|uniref:Membrane protein domain-containing protein n=1 Tax=Ditylenchus destructor TaxID=166010 RepID=A0AAD4NFK2_9BILA|nr:putative membrane protein domain-containing protein [Ditylenchus destructor]